MLGVKTAVQESCKMGRFIKNLIIIVVFTLFTQVGGLIWLAFLPFYQWLKGKFVPKWEYRLVGITSFTCIYCLVSLYIVPPLAKWQCGRVPLPIFSDSNLKPHNVLYFCLLNHHYVRPAVKESCEKVANQMAIRFPGTKTYYLDANFPFFNGYPLEPHFTHRNGTTVDMAFDWLDVKSGNPMNGAPTTLAYGASAKPLQGEVDMEEKCGNFLRSFEMRVTKHFYKEESYKLDETRTAELIQLFSNQKSVHKILLEPHLKTRLGLDKIDKIRFQGCKAARHDDHFHVIW
ncbi:MAG: hypothetical protein GC192_02360 [Bacteroidetes bacterium]|nr:hypothetical protein [Bacteroidota bacterium]